MRELEGVGEVGRNGKWYRFVAVIIIPNGVPLIYGFAELQRSEARLIKKYKKWYVIVQYYGARKENT